VDRYFEILKRTRAKAGQDTVYDKRIDMIENDMLSLKKLFPKPQAHRPMAPRLSRARVVPDRWRPSVAIAMHAGPGPAWQIGKPAPLPLLTGEPKR